MSVAENGGVQVLDDELLHGREEKVAHEGRLRRLVQALHLDVACLERLVAQRLKPALAKLQAQRRAGAHDRLGVLLVEGDDADREELPVEE
jgi:hypothetical protein